MADVDMNLWAVIVAAVASFVIGMAWYSPFMFGNVWMRLSGVNPKKSEMNPASSMIVGFIAGLVLAYVLALFIRYSGAATFGDGLVIGVLAWLGFVATKSLGMVLWEGKPFSLYVLHVAYDFVAFLIMGGILAAWV